MKTMTYTMPLISVFMGFTLPAGLGLYWAASAAVRCIQQLAINKYLSTKSLDEMIKENQKKAQKKREKHGTSAKEINKMATTSTRNVGTVTKGKSGISEAEKEEKIQKAQQKAQNSKPGSLASKANLVSRYNSGQQTNQPKTVDDAITEALIQLGVTSDRLEYEVIEKGSAGFLGIGMKQAVIEARRKPEPKEEKVEEPVVEEPVKAEPKKVEAVQPQKAAAEKKVDEPQKAAFEKAVEKEVKEEVKKETKLVEVQPQTIEAVEDFLKNTMKAMDMEVELKTEIDQDGALCVDMSGEHMGILIGKRGQTLDSLQYLANRVANKHQEGYVRVKLDTENYRARREETLRHLAKNIAHKVKRNRRPVALEPMNPYERRIIHSALQSDPYVMTHSEGEEPFRKVVITLKK